VQVGADISLATVLRRDLVKKHMNFSRVLAPTQKTTPYSARIRLLFLQGEVLAGDHLLAHGLQD
jgi:hypothetical protein